MIFSLPTRSPEWGQDLRGRVRFLSDQCLYVQLCWEISLLSYSYIGLIYVYSCPCPADSDRYSDLS